MFSSDERQWFPAITFCDTHWDSPSWCPKSHSHSAHGSWNGDNLWFCREGWGVPLGTRRSWTWLSGTGRGRVFLTPEVSREIVIPVNIVSNIDGHVWSDFSVASGRSQVSLKIYLITNGKFVFDCVFALSCNISGSMLKCGWNCIIFDLLRMQWMWKRIIN